MVLFQGVSLSYVAWAYLVLPNILWQVPLATNWIAATGAAGRVLRRPVVVYVWSDPVWGVVLCAGRLSPCHRQSASFCGGRLVVMLLLAALARLKWQQLFAQTCRPNEPNNTSNAL